MQIYALFGAQSWHHLVAATDARAARPRRHLECVLPVDALSHASPILQRRPLNPNLPLATASTCSQHPTGNGVHLFSFIVPFAHYPLLRSAPLRSAHSPFSPRTRSPPRPDESSTAASSTAGSTSTPAKRVRATVCLARAQKQKLHIWKHDTP